MVISTEDVWWFVYLVIFFASAVLCRYFCVYIASPANELSCERRDQTQGAA